MPLERCGVCFSPSCVCHDRDCLPPDALVNRPELRRLEQQLAALEAVLRRLVEMAGPCEAPTPTTNGLPMCYRHRLAWPCPYHEGRRLVEGEKP